jgi:hypothetical protein
MKILDTFFPPAPPLSLTRPASSRPSILFWQVTSTLPKKIGFPFSIHDKHDKTYPEQYSSAQDRSSRKSPNLSTTNGKKPASRKGRARLCRLLAQCTILLAERSFYIMCFCQPTITAVSRSNACIPDGSCLKTRDFCDVHDYNDLQNTRQHFLGQLRCTSIFFMDFLTFILSPLLHFLLCTTVLGYISSPILVKLSPHSLWYFR